jgi:hypothetical protein
VREADHSPPASAEIKKIWIYTSTPPYAFMASCLISYAQGELYIYLTLYDDHYENLNSSNTYWKVGKACLLVTPVTEHPAAGDTGQWWVRNRRRLWKWQRKEEREKWDGRVVKKSVKRHETALRDKQDLLDKVYYACPTN